MLARLARSRPGAVEVPALSHDNRRGRLLLFPGARVMITQNKSLAKQLMNGQVAVVVEIRDRFVVPLLPDGATAALPLSRTGKRAARHEAFALAGGYAMTIHKSQGLTLPRAVIYWDSGTVQEGLGYTALSRVRRLSDLSFIGAPLCVYFKPTRLSSPTGR